MKINYSRLPEHMRDSVKGYIEWGYPIGGFLTAVFSNDLLLAFAKADSINMDHLKDWAVFLWNEAPPESWGSADKIAKWQKQGGMLNRTV